MSNKITVGQATHKHDSSNKKLYAGRSTGKVTLNGGFNGCINVGYSNIDDDKWKQAFPNTYVPKWMNNK